MSNLILFAYNLQLTLFLIQNNVAEIKRKKTGPPEKVFKMIIWGFWIPLCRKLFANYKFGLVHVKRQMQAAQFSEAPCQHIMHLITYLITFKYFIKLYSLIVLHNTMLNIQYFIYRKHLFKKSRLIRASTRKPCRVSKQEILPKRSKIVLDSVSYLVIF